MFIAILIGLVALYFLVMLLLGYGYKTKWTKLSTGVWTNLTPLVSPKKTRLADRIGLLLITVVLFSFSIVIYLITK